MSGIPSGSSGSAPSTRLPIVVYRCLKRVEAVLSEAGAAREPVVLAVSGGGDSMALLELVALLVPRLELVMHVACIDHGIRPEAQAELELVREAARVRSAVFHGVRIDPGAGDEDSLRSARHSALAQIAEQAGARFVLLGHTSDDQVETILFRFLRGAGLGGLSGMQQRRGALLRPLLLLRRDELREVLAARGVEFAEDASNESDRYARGRLRNSVIPALVRAFGRGSLDHLLDLAPRWRADEEYLEQEARGLLVRASHRDEHDETLDSLDVAVLAGAHRALRSRALRQWLMDRTKRMPTSRELAAVERWLDEPRPTSAIDVADARLRKRRGQLRIEMAQSGPTRIDGAATSADVAGSGAARRGKTVAGGEDAVLPPSDGRVRFPRT